MAEDALEFSFPGATANAFVSNYSNDISFDATSGITVMAVPEPGV